MLRPSLLFVVSLLSVGAAGCPHRYDFGLDPADDPGEILAEARALLARPKELRGEAKLKFRLPRGRFGADHLVALELPDRLRLDTLSFFGSPLAVLLLQDGELLLWDIEGDKAYQGKATIETLRRIFPIELDPAQVIALVLGDPPLMPAVHTKLVLDHGARAYRVDRDGPEGGQQIWFDPKAGHMLRMRTEPRVGEGWEVAYEDYRPISNSGTGVLPFTLRYTRGGTGLVWRWRTLEADAEGFSRDVFKLVLPEGVSVLRLDDAQEEAASRAPLHWLPEEAAAAPQE